MTSKQMCKMPEHLNKYVLKAFLSCFIAIILTGCGNSNQNFPSGTDSDTSVRFVMNHELKLGFRVYKIDSIRDYYLLYIVHNDDRFKIISKKNGLPEFNKVVVGGLYDFQIDGIFGMIAGGVYKPKCVAVDGKTEICLEDSIIDLCYVKNMERLNIRPIK